MGQKIGDRGHELVAVVLALALADPVDGAQRPEIDGLLAGHLDQGPVREDHEGRDALGPGERGAQAAQVLEQRLVGLREGDLAVLAGGGPAALAGFGLRLRIGAELDRLPAEQDRLALLGHGQAAVAVGVLGDRPGGEELAQDRPPGRHRLVGPDPEGLEARVAVAADLVALLPVDHVADIGSAEALAGAHDRRQDLLGRDGPVHEGDAAAAQVAAAASTARLAEIGEQRLAAAGGALAQGDHRLELAPLDPAAVVRDLLLVDLAAAERHVVEAVEGQGVGGQPVAAGAADLLIVALDVVGHVGVADEAHVRLVDAHAEGDGGGHHHPVLLQEPVLVRHPRRLVEAGMVGQGVEPVLPEGLGQLLGALARRAVDDPALRAPVLQEPLNLPGRVVLGLEGQPDVRPVEGVDEDLRGPVLREQALGDLGAGRGVGGGGERQGLDVAQGRPGSGDLPVLGPEVVAPLRDAMLLPVIGDTVMQLGINPYGRLPTIFRHSAPADLRRNALRRGRRREAGQVSAAASTSSPEWRLSGCGLAAAGFATEFSSEHPFRMRFLCLESKQQQLGRAHIHESRT